MLALKRRAVLNKRDMYSRYKCGEFGNTLRSWTWKEWLESPPKSGTVNIHSQGGGGRFFEKGVPVQDVRKIVKIARLAHNDILFRENVPDDKLILQGYVFECPILVLEFSTKKNETLRAAASRQGGWEHRAEGVCAKVILEWYLEPRDYEWLRSLLDFYPYHVVEFSLFSVPLGSWESGLVIWEVRNY